MAVAKVYFGDCVQLPTAAQNRTEGVLYLQDSKNLRIVEHCIITRNTHNVSSRICELLQNLRESYRGS